MDNGQSAALELSSEYQVILSAYFGDGSIKHSRNTAQFMGTCKSLIEFKAKILNKEVSEKVNLGWGSKPIYWFRTLSKDTAKVRESSLKENLESLTDLGIALWFYDDGSLHKKKLFYNLCTHSFSKEAHEEFLIPYFTKLGLSPVLRTENKKDGRVFYYLSFNKYGGAYEISEILRKYYIEDMSYKLWSSETSQKWRTLQEQWKSEGGSKTFQKWAFRKI